LNHPLRYNRERRLYRSVSAHPSRPAFTVRVKETDLRVYAPPALEALTRERIMVYRGHIEAYIHQNPEFLTSLKPWRPETPVPQIVEDMIRAGDAANVGPMAAVAGAIAERVGRDLLQSTEDVIIENGGDIFVHSRSPLTVAIYAGESPLSLRVGIKLRAGQGMGVCTSSATVGHSLSMGRADAVCVVSPSCALADAAATAIGNRVSSARDLSAALHAAGNIETVVGAVIIIGDRLGVWGDLELLPIHGKRG